MGITGAFVQKSDSKAQLHPVESESHGSGLRNTDLGAAKVVPHTGNIGPPGQGMERAWSLTAGLAHTLGGREVLTCPREPFRGLSRSHNP